jgi:hypothetical protein
VGAQYVASLDGNATGGLIEMPRVGTSMLFARVDEHGRVSLVRTATLTAFESHLDEDDEADAAQAPTTDSVETSAPRLRPPSQHTSTGETLPRELLATRPRFGSAGASSSHRAPESGDSRPTLRDPDYEDHSERTQRIQALRPHDLAAARRDMETAERDTTDLRERVNARMALGRGRPSSSLGAIPPQQTAGREPSSRGPRADANATPAAARALEPEPHTIPQARASNVQLARRRRRES